MKKFLLLLAVASCTTPQTPNQACVNYCSTSGTVPIQEFGGVCICQTYYGIQQALIGCVNESTSEEAQNLCFLKAKERCADPTSKNNQLINPICKLFQ